MVFIIPSPFGRHPTETSNAHDSICRQPVCIVSYKSGRKTRDASFCSQTFLSTSSGTGGCGHSRTVRLWCGCQQQNSYTQTTWPTMEDTRQYQCRVLEPSTIRLEKQSSFDFPVQLATIEPQDTDFRTSRQICGKGLLQSQMQSRHPWSHVLVKNSGHHALGVRCDKHDCYCCAVIETRGVQVIISRPKQ